MNTKKADVTPVESGDLLLTVADLTTPPSIVRLEIPELSRGGRTPVVYVRPIVAGDALDEAEASGEKVSSESFILRMMVLAVVDQHGNPLFTDRDMPKLRNMPLAVFNRISSVVTGGDAGKGSAGETVSGGGSSTA